MQKKFRISNFGFRIKLKTQNPHSAIRNPQSAGFTLIELMVVIIVLGVMMSLVIPALSDIGEANLKRSTRHLTGMIRFLRDEAQAKKTVYRLKFDIQGGKYWAEEFIILSEGAPEGSSEGTAEFKRLQVAMASEGSLAGQITFRDVHAGSHPDDPYILFTPDGWVEPALIHLRDGDDRPFTLIVKPLTGNTELREGEVEER